MRVLGDEAHAVGGDGFAVEELVAVAHRRGRHACLTQQRQPLGARFLRETVDRGLQVGGRETKSARRGRRLIRFDHGRNREFGTGCGDFEMRSMPGVAAQVMLDPATPPSTKVSAADRILNNAAKAIELEDIDARMSEVERATEALKAGYKK